MFVSILYVGHILSCDCRFVDSFGYVQLFPFLLKMVPPDSKKLGLTLNKIRNTSVGGACCMTSLPVYHVTSLPVSVAMD